MVSLTVLTGCAEKRIYSPIGYSPSSISICSQYMNDAYTNAQQHCAKSKKNAELIGALGECHIANYMPMFKHPQAYNFKCVN